jgi:type IV pilus assembly protein PilB
MSDGADRWPGHLKPVPHSGTENVATAPDEGPDGDKEGTPGLTEPSALARPGSFLSDVIADLGYASRERVDAAVSEARNLGRPPEALLLEAGTIDSDQLSRAIAERYGLPHVDLSTFHVDMAAANLIPANAARRYGAVPVQFIDERTVLLAMSDPANVVAVDDVRMMTGHDCRPAVAASEDVEALIGRLNTLESAVSEAVADEGEEEEGSDLADVSELRESADDAPVVKLVHSILGQAVAEGASDIHFEPQDREMRVRFRVDGVLHEAATVPRRMIAGVVSRVKIMCDMDIAEKRMPQDGRAGLTVDGRKVDVRATTLPTAVGESASLRILDKSNALIDLDALGIEGGSRERFESAFRQPYGAVFATGPTGSGKSTTLYAAVNAINDIEKNIVTIEDPVEYQLPGVTQIQVNRKAGVTFASGLRSVLRADPDVIMVGEIRDSETAQIAVEAALTGHLVLSTLHTNNAPAAINRLTEMGVETFLTSSALDCVVAQRLARTLCTHCKRRVLVSADSMAQAGFRVGADLEAYEPAGCGRCGGSGYRGRIGLFEVMPVSDEIKALTIRRASDEEIAAVAREQGMRTLREDGLEKVRSGLTSVEEVTRVSS